MTQVNPETLTFGATGWEDSLERMSFGPVCGGFDVDGDGDDDLLCAFDVEASGLHGGSVEAFPARPDPRQGGARQPSLRSGPKLKRTLARARASDKPIASSTGLGSWLPDEQADPELAWTPSRSRFIISACPSTSTNSRFECLGPRSAPAPLTSSLHRRKDPRFEQVP